MNRMNQYLFFVDLPLLEQGFYFFAEETLMKRPPVDYKQMGENEILDVRRNKDGKIEFKKLNKSSIQLVLNEIRKCDTYPEYEGEEKNLFYHYHNLFEISIILSGEGYYFVEGHAIKVQAGSIVVFNGLVPHAWVANEENPPLQRTFSFYQNLFLENEMEKDEKKMINDYLNTFTVLDIHGKDAECIFNLLQLMYEEYTNKNRGYRSSIKSLLLMVLIYFIRYDKKSLEMTRKTKTNDQLEEAIKYMKNNFHLNITLEDVAKKVYMHPNYFSTVFKRKYGTNFVDYMNRLKVSMAAELMESTDLSIASIATRCGFKSLSNFYRVFKNIYGVSPSKYISEL